MKYALLVTASPSHCGAHSALRFAQALLDQGHSIGRIFFYGDGVWHASRLQQPPQGEAPLYRQWLELTRHSDTELVVCIAAALRRGIVDEREASRYQLTAANLAEGFILSGLGQLVEASVDCDRLISLG